MWANEKGADRVDMVQMGGKCLQELLSFPVLLRASMEFNHLCLHFFFRELKFINLI